MAVVAAPTIPTGKNLESFRELRNLTFLCKYKQKRGQWPPLCQIVLIIYFVPFIIGFFAETIFLSATLAIGFFVETFIDVDFPVFLGYIIILFLFGELTLCSYVVSFLGQVLIFSLLTSYSSNNLSNGSASGW